MKPTGTLIRKIQCQLECSVIYPPSVGPSTGPTIDHDREGGKRHAAFLRWKRIGEDRLLDRRQPAAADPLEHARDAQA